MSYSLLINTDNNDIVIGGRSFVLVNASDEVRQRIRTTLNHFFGEYFLDTTDGTPWNEEILGQSSDAGTINTVLRNRVLSVPGVLRVNTLTARFDNVFRQYIVLMDVDVQAGLNESSNLTSQEFVISPEDTL